MLDSKKQPHPVKPHLSLREENDVITHVVNIEFSTWERGLDERRLSCVIDDGGVVGNTLSPYAAGRLPSACWRAVRVVCGVYDRLRSW